MTMNQDYYAIVIGAGAGGLVIAKGLGQAGKKVLLVEKGPYGGNCANFGCIPSTSLIASANIAHELWSSSLFGIDMRMENFNANRVFSRVRDIVQQVRDRYSPEVLQSQGVETCSGTCVFIDPHTVEVELQDGTKRKHAAKYIVIATGSYPYIPEMKGLGDVPYLTTYNVFDLKEIPTSLAIIGGGQIGCELAQAFRRLGSRVVLIEQKEYLLGTEEPEAYKAIQSSLVKEGVEIYLGHQVVHMQHNSGKIFFNLRRKTDEKEYEVSAEQLLLTTGRRPNIDHLGLAFAGVAYTSDGIAIDEYGRTTQPHIFAVGDVTGHSFYTHAAESQARTILANLLWPWPMQFKMDTLQPIPRVIYTDPEIASIGLTEEEAIEKYGARNIAIYVVPLSEADRAICESRTEGFVKFVTKRFSSKILGATIVAPIAADMLLEISCAMRYKVPLRKLSSLIHPFPTYSQIIRKAADAWLSETLFPLVKRLVSFGR